MKSRTLTVAVDFFLYTSLFAACCTVGLCLVTEHLLLQTRPSVFNALHVFVFGATLLVYNTHYLIKKSAPSASDRFRWTRKNKTFHYLFLAVGALLCALSLPYLPRTIFYACVVLGVLSFGYSLPLLPFPRKKRFKDFGIIKILLLTTVWTIVTSVLPILYYHHSPLAYPYEILLRFSFMLTLCIAFDIRDAQTDSDNGITTLPNIIGIASSYRLMDATLLTFAAFSVVQYFRYPSVPRLSIALLTALCTKLAIEYTRRRPSDKAYLALIDGMMLFYAAMTLLY